MKPEHKAMFKYGGSFGLVGAGLLAVVGTTVAWAALAYGTYKVSKAAYQNAKLSAMLQEDDGNWRV